MSAKVLRFPKRPDPIQAMLDECAEIEARHAEHRRAFIGRLLLAFGAVFALLAGAAWVLRV